MFYLSVACLLIFYTLPFEAEVFNFDEVQFVIFFFYD